MPIQCTRSNVFVERGASFSIGRGNEEAQFGKVAAGQKVQNSAVRSKYFLLKKNIFEYIPMYVEAIAWPCSTGSYTRNGKISVELCSERSKFTVLDRSEYVDLKQHLTPKREQMLNFLLRRKPWILASMLVATTLFGQNSSPKNAMPNRKNEATQDPVMTSGYNASSRINVASSWDVFTTGSFVYWQAIEDNIETAMLFKDDKQLVSSGAVIIDMNYKYKPGFKVGLGMNFDYDQWMVCSEYTWYRSKNHVTVAPGPLPNRGRVTNLWEPILKASQSTEWQVLGFWHLNLDFVDLLLKRSYYAGNRLTLAPFLGIRAAWIDQIYKTHSPTHIVIDHGQRQDKQSTNSWGVGARTGLNTNWLLGYGIRLYGNTALDMLYTQYSRHILHVAPGLPSTNIVNLHEYGISRLRSSTEIELGLGWGSYVSDREWHIDLSAGYLFKALWEQNMFMQYPNTVTRNLLFSRGGSLYLQGLTANARLDF